MTTKVNIFKPRKMQIIDYQRHSPSTARPFLSGYNKIYLTTDADLKLFLRQIE